MPQDIPNLCVPDFGKADLPRLHQDLPKWKQWLSSSSNNNWTHFEAHTLPALKQPTASPWPLTTLVPFLPEENSSVPIDEDLEDLFEKAVHRSALSVAIIIIVHYTIPPYKYKKKSKHVALHKTADSNCMLIIKKQSNYLPAGHEVLLQIPHHSCMPKPRGTTHTTI